MNVNLKAARDLRALFDKPDSWIQGNMARDANGRVRHLRNPKATCWCVYGGVDRVSPTAEITNNLLRAAKIHTGTLMISPWNDRRGRTHADIITLCDYLIEVFS